jgi:large subunit ribosomal protein L15
LPKRGFRVPFPVETVAINLAQLERFDAGTTVDFAALSAARLLQKSGARVKVLGGGELTKKLTIHTHRISASARLKVEAVGGTVVLVPEGPTSDSGSAE